MLYNILAVFIMRKPHICKIYSYLWKIKITNFKNYNWTIYDLLFKRGRYIIKLQNKGHTRISLSRPVFYSHFKIRVIMESPCPSVFCYSPYIIRNIHVCLYATPTSNKGHIGFPLSIRLFLAVRRRQPNLKSNCQLVCVKSKVKVFVSGDYANDDYDYIGAMTTVPQKLKQ